MKKLTALLMALMLILMCSACSKEEEGPSSSGRKDTHNALVPLVTSVPERNEPDHVNSEVGDIITFGSYEHDNYLDNGPEAIEWIVLDVQDGKALLLSRYGLDAKTYHSELTQVTWETCALRSWLNNDFLNEVFSAKEQSAILTTEVDNSDAQSYTSEYGVTGGNNTTDKIFLLSYAEAKQYLNVTVENRNMKKARVAPTEFAIANGADTNKKYQTTEGKDAGWWWLRSPGSYQHTALGVHYGGTVDTDFVYSNIYNYSVCHVVRPAFWLDLNSYN